MSKDLIEQIKMLLKHIQENPETLEKAKIFDLKTRKLLADTGKKPESKPQDFSIDKPSKPAQAAPSAKPAQTQAPKIQPKGAYAIKLKDGYLFGTNVTKDGQTKSPSHHDVLNWLKDKNIDAEVVDYRSVPESERKKMSGHIADLLALNDPHTIYETSSYDKTPIKIDAIIEKHPNSPDYKEDNYIPKKQVSSNVNLAFTPMSSVQSNRFGTPEGNLWITTAINSHTGEVRHSISNNKDESRLGAYYGKTLGQEGNPELMPDIIGQKQHKGSLIAGANTYIRERIPFFILQKLDLHPFYEKTESGHRVGIMATDKNGSNRPMYVYSDSEKSPREALNNAINHFVLEAVKKHYKDEVGGGTFDTGSKEPDKKNQKLNTWLTHSIYRSPKVNLKDFLNEPQTAQKSTKDNYFESLKKAKVIDFKTKQKLADLPSKISNDYKTHEFCPNCQSDNIANEDDANQFNITEVTCHDCGEQWQEKIPKLDIIKSILKKTKVIDFQTRLPKKIKSPSLKTPKQTKPKQTSLKQTDPDELQRVLNDKGILTNYDMHILETRTKEISDAIEMTDPNRDGDVIDNLIKELDQLSDRVKLSLGQITEEPTKQPKLKIVPTQKSELNYFQALKKAKIYSFKDKKMLSDLPSTITPKEAQPIFRDRKKGITSRKHLKQAYSPNIMPEKQDVPGGDGTGKSEELDKGSLQRKFKFNPKKTLKESDLNTIKEWTQGNGKHAYRSRIPQMPDNAKIRALNKLMNRTKWRKNNKTGEREFLLHRQMGQEEFANTFNNKIISHDKESSWTPDIDTTLKGIYAPENLADYFDYNHIVSAWIPESKIKTYLPQYGIDPNNNTEQETILHPHSSEVYKIYQDDRIKHTPDWWKVQDEDGDYPETGFDGWKWKKIFDSTEKTNKSEELDKGLLGDFSKDPNYKFKVEHHEYTIPGRPGKKYRSTTVNAYHKDKKFSNQDIFNIMDNSEGTYRSFNEANQIFNHPELGGMVGSATFDSTSGNKDEGMVGHVHVDEAHRRKGLATQMYKLFEESTGMKAKPSTAQYEAAKKLWSQPNRPFGKEELDKGLKGDWKKEGYKISYNKPSSDPKTKYDSEHIFVAKDKAGSVVGSARFTSNHHIKGYIEGTQVHPKHRRKGLATAMYQMAEKKLKTKLSPAFKQSKSAKALWAQPNRPFGKSEQLNKNEKYNGPSQKVGYSTSAEWKPLHVIKNLEKERGNLWPVPTNIDHKNKDAIWVTHKPEHAIIYNSPSEFREYDINKPLPKTHELHQEFESYRKKLKNPKSHVNEVDLAGAKPVLYDGDGGYLYIKPKINKSENYYKNLIKSVLEKNLKPKYILEDLTKAKVFSLASGKLQFDTSKPEHKLDTTDPSHLMAAGVLPKGDPNRKKGMMIVGSNMFARTNLPKDILSNHDVSYHFFPAAEKTWRVGATITEKKGDKASFVEANGLDINQTLKDLNKKIEQRASNKEQDWHTFDQSKMNILNNHLYRQPKISLKDIQSLEPYKPE